MKKKSNSQSAFFNLRVLIGLFVFLAGVFLALFATANPSSGGGLRLGAFSSASIAASARSSAEMTAQTLIRVTPEGVAQIHEFADSKRAFATLAPRETRVSAPSGKTVWSFDDETAIADGVAIDDLNVWGAWDLTGSHLTAHPVAGDGTPSFEFTSFGSGTSGVASAKAADRILFFEGNVDNNDYRLHSFTSQSNGVPDWSFQLPPTVTGLDIDTKWVAASYDGSTVAATVRDSTLDESTLSVFDAETGDIVFTWTQPGFMGGVDLTDDGSIALVTHTFNTDLASVVDTVTGEVLFQIAGTGAGITHYRISGDGSILVVGGFSLHVYEFDGTTYQRIIDFTQPSSWFGQASIVSRDGSTVGTFAGNFASNWTTGEVFLFDVASRDLIGSHPVTGSGDFTGVPIDADSSDDGTVMAFASWGTQNNDWPEVMVFNRNVELIGEIDFPGSAFRADVTADGRFVVGGAKAVHANEFGSGGRIELIQLQPQPTPTPSPTATATPTVTPTPTTTPSPTATPTPTATPRPTPLPRPRPSPHPRPTP